MRIRLTPTTRQRAIEQLRNAPDGHFYMPPVEPNRTLAANACMWALLNDIAKQVRWPVNGKEQLLDAASWKDVFTASLNQEQRLTAGLQGGVVLLGASTSAMSQRKIGELIDLIHAFGAERGVVFSEPVIEVPGWVQ
jgi:hypothetical protein